jgi:hypothetical protein
MQESNVPPTTQNIQNQGRNKLLVIIAILLFFLLVISLGIGGYFLLSLNKDTSDNTNDTNEKHSCTYNNKSYNNGDSFKALDGCNTCACNDGSISCTEMACLSTTTIPETVVKIYLANPSSFEDFQTLITVDRKTSETDLYTFALDQLILGPTSTEKTKGYISTFELTGASNCGGKDYAMTKSGTKISITFCKEIQANFNPGEEGAWAGISLTAMGRVYTVIEKSLSFNGVNLIEVKDKNGLCYAFDAGVNKDCTE